MTSVLASSCFLISVTTLTLMTAYVSTTPTTSATTVSRIMPTRIEQKTPCTALVDGRLINLLPLANANFKPRYSAQVGPWVYSFNPCLPFNLPDDPYISLGDQCAYVAMCQSRVTPEGTLTYTRGIQQGIKFLLQHPVTASPQATPPTGDEEWWPGLIDKDDTDNQWEPQEDTRQEQGGQGEGQVEDEAEEHSKQDDDLEEESEEEDDSEEEDEDNDELQDDEEEDELKGDSVEDEFQEEDEAQDDMEKDDDQEHDLDENSLEFDNEEDKDGTVAGGEDRVRENSRRVQNIQDEKGIEQINDRLEEHMSDNIEGKQQQQQEKQDGVLVEAGLADARSGRRRKRPRQSQRKERRRQRRDSNKQALNQMRQLSEGNNSTQTMLSDLPMRNLERENIQAQETALALQLKGLGAFSGERTYVMLVCDTKASVHHVAQFRFLNFKDSTMYFELSHVCCCPDACTTGVTRDAAALDPNGKDGKPKHNWPPPALLWVVAAIFVVLFMAIVIGTSCGRNGGLEGPYTMLPGLHASRLTINSMESTRMANIKYPSPDYRDYTSHIKHQANAPIAPDSGIIPANQLEIGQRLGGGLFGDTYIGEYCEYNIAAKRITVGIHQGQLNERTRVWLCDTVKDLAVLQHKHIVVVLGVCLDLRQPHIIKEYVDGTSLRTLLETVTDGSLSYIRKLRMLMQAAEGMAYLHSSKHSILHRDIRCSNLLVTKGDDHVKITDFGMVHLLHKLRVQCSGREGCYCRKATAAFPASIRWTAPEVLRHPAMDEGSSEIFGPACDVYSFSMTIWEAMNVSDPWFDIRNEDTVAEMVLCGSRPKCWVVDGAQDSHVNLMTACWTENPDKRPSFKQIVSYLSSQIRRVSKDDRHRDRRDSSSSTMTYFKSLNMA